MAQPYVGEIRMFGGNFAPNGWMFCSGQLLPIAEYETLFNLIGTTYGGDGESTFGLPNLQSRVPVHMGTNVGNTYLIGEMDGVESVTLTVQQIPSHTHPMMGSTNPAALQTPATNVIGKSTQVDLFINAQPGDQLNAQAVGPAGGSQPHENCQPFQCVNYIISLFGIFPSQN